jgi:hypothetical protein
MIVDLCTRFGCLPSQLLQEDARLLGMVELVAIDDAARGDR